MKNIFKSKDTTKIDFVKCCAFGNSFFDISLSKDWTR